MTYDEIVWKISQYGGVIAAVVFVARIIVKLTPTPKDDTWLQTVVDILKHVGLQLPSSTDQGTGTGNGGNFPGGVDPNPTEKK
jgi:hypothetical protein